MFNTSTRVKHHALAAALALLLATAPSLAQPAASAAVSAQSSVDGVTVKVMPKPMAAGEGRREFTVVFDAHSADLKDDVVQTTVLVTTDGRTLKPVSWSGSAPGGHHREGVLAFELPPPEATSIELRMQRPGEAAPRIFRFGR
jgi:hypothetical protein